MHIHVLIQNYATENIINRLPANNNFSYGCVICHATTLCTIISMEKIWDAGLLIKKKQYKMNFLLLLLLICDVLEQISTKKKPYCVRSTRESDLLKWPILAFMEIYVLPLIWQQKHIFPFLFQLFSICSFIVPY